VFSKTFAEHLDRLRLVLNRLKESNLKLKPSKYSLFQEMVKFIGSIISADGIRPDPDKVQAVAEARVASTTEPYGGSLLLRSCELLQTTHSIVC